MTRVPSKTSRVLFNNVYLRSSSSIGHSGPQSATKPRRSNYPRVESRIFNSTDRTVTALTRAGRSQHYVYDDARLAFSNANQMVNPWDAIDCVRATQQMSG